MINILSVLRQGGGDRLSSRCIAAYVDAAHCIQYAECQGGCRPYLPYRNVAMRTRQVKNAHEEISLGSQDSSSSMANWVAAASA